MTTWTPKTPQSETWTPNAGPAVRAFDPHGFDRTPRFDTGVSSGVWDARTEQAEVWVNA
jgi:hypothetical protein